MRRLFIRTSVVVVCLLRAMVAADAAPFVNLDFEQSTVQPGDPSGVPAAAAFPGWTPRVGNNIVNVVAHNYPGGGEGLVALYDQDATDLGIPLLQGHFMAVLHFDIANGNKASLGQVGDVPSDARSIRLIAEVFRGPPSLIVNGTALPLTKLQGGNNNGDIGLYGADISTFAGQTIDLRIQSRLIEGFDDVTFSSTPIPEPTAATVLMGTVAWLCCRQRRVSRKDSRDDEVWIYSAWGDHP